MPYDVKVYARTKEGKGPKALAEAVPMGKVSCALPAVCARCAFVTSAAEPRADGRRRR